MLARTTIPKGVRVFPPADAARRQVVEAALLSVFRRWGFREVILSAWCARRTCSAATSRGPADSGKSGRWGSSSLGLEAAEADAEMIAMAVEALPGPYGGRAVLEEAAKLSFPPESGRALANLVEVVTILENYGLADHVILDLAEAHAFEYCTGVVFGAFARGLGYQISNGGRCDHLIGQFGYPCPATGFSFNLDRIMAALEAAAALPDVAGPDVLLIDFSPDKRAAHRLARALRERGLAVARDIIRREPEGSLAYGKASGIRRAVILGAAGRPPGSAVIVDLASDAERVLPLHVFEQAIERGGTIWPE